MRAEYQQSDFLKDYRRRTAELAAFAGPRRLGTTGDSSCETLYVVRCVRPAIVVETGVLYGASSSHILAALATVRASSTASISTWLPTSRRTAS